jgi:hypothetical protein
MARIKQTTLKLQGILALAALLGTAVAVPAPARAQYYGGPILSERMVLQSLSQRGFRRLSPPVLNNDVFVLDAIDPNGRPMRLIVSAANARIVDAHPQRHTRWTRAEPPAGWDEPDEDRRDGWRADRWRGERWRDRQARLPDEDWPENRWNGPQIDPDDDRFPDDSQPVPGSRRAPERVTVAPLPAPSATPRDPDLPQPTLKNPTIVKRSPTAIPKDPAETTAPRPKAPAVSTAPQPKPGMGTRDNPRVIDMTPKAPATQTPAAASPRAEPAKPAASAKSASPPSSAPAMPPPAVLDSPPAVAPPPAVATPPAILE